MDRFARALAVQASATGRVQLHHITSSGTVGDSVYTRLLAFNAFARGWAHHYKHGFNCRPVFGSLGSLGHYQIVKWLARKYRCKMKTILRTRRRVVDGRVTIGQGPLYLWLMTWLPHKWLRVRTIPSAYESSDSPLVREELFQSAFMWSGHEKRTGSSDARLACLVRDDRTCSHCGRKLLDSEAEIDHIKPVRRFKTPAAATFLGNLQTLCKACHKVKGEDDRRMESRMQGNLHVRFGEGGGGNVPVCEHR